MEYNTFMFQLPLPSFDNEYFFSFFICASVGLFIYFIYCTITFTIKWLIVVLI